MTENSKCNLIQDATRTFNYDARGRMTSVTKNNKTTQYYYNGLGQRFGKNGVVYMYDLEGHLIGEYTNTGALIQKTVWLRVVTDTTQKPVWRWDGDAFGRGLPNEDPLKAGTKFLHHLRYPGQHYDTESGFHYT